MPLKLANLFVPNRANNYKAKLLHNFNLTLMLVSVLAFQSISFIFRPTATQVLGVSTDLTPPNIIELTNQERTSSGLAPLATNEELSQAAQLKLNDMFEFNYWNHYSPSKRAPWKFILDSGYSYQFAGENLGRDFNTSEKLVQAWMASEGHKANILKSEYTDIGVAIGEGQIDNQPTILIVQFFASPAPVGSISTVGQDPVDQSEVFNLAGSLSNQVEGSHNLSYFSTQMIAFIAIGALMLILTIDIILLKHHKKIPRISAKYWAHMTFLISCSAIGYILTK